MEQTRINIKNNNNLEHDEFEITVAQTRRLRKRNDETQYNSKHGITECMTERYWWKWNKTKIESRLAWLQSQQKTNPKHNATSKLWFEQQTQVGNTRWECPQHREGISPLNGNINSPLQEGCWSLVLGSFKQSSPPMSTMRSLASGPHNPIVSSATGMKSSQDRGLCKIWHSCQSWHKDYVEDIGVWPMSSYFKRLQASVDAAAPAWNRVSNIGNRCEGASVSGRWNPKPWTYLQTTERGSCHLAVYHLLE